MASLWKLLDWFRSERSATPEEPAEITEEFPPEESSAPEEEPAFDLFPEEAERERSTDRRPLGVSARLVSGAFTTADPVTVRDISPTGVYFFASYKLSLGQLIEITLTEPDTEEKVCYHANVVRLESSGENQFGVAARITRREILGK
jgi:hypothetical protein